MDELKDDLKILSSLGIKILRTYNLQLPQAPNILKAIKVKNQTLTLKCMLCLELGLTVKMLGLITNHEKRG